MTDRTRVRIRRLSLVVLAAMGVLTTPGLIAQSCANCGGPVGFRLHAFDGLIARNGGKCLDYQPEVVGAPVGLNDCPLAHAVVVQEIPNQQHQVFLRAGTKVIGARRPLPVPGDDIDDGSPAGVPVDPVLELQDPGVACTNVLEPCVADQTFALDGDSIRLASNHQRVVKVIEVEGSIRALGIPGGPRSWPAFTWVARNFIHHNRACEKGYGVNANAGAFPLIDGNVFVENRHAIAGTEATAHTGYRAWHNLVLSAVPLQRGTFHTHDFDMHGRGSGGKGGRAGGYVDLYGNTFLGTTRANFEIRGTPCNFVDVRNNVFLQERRDALSLDVGILGSGSVAWVIPPAPAQFDRPDPAREFGVGDFDGDGVQDLFLATGSAWYYSPQGVAEWRLLNDNPDRLDTLLFGDFDGDGRTDVLGKNGRRLVASWGGASDWDTVNEIDAPMRDLAVGDFDASGQADIFHADGESWFVAYDNGPFVEVNTSSFRVNQLRFGDFDGSGTTDVFGVGSRDWQVSYSATSGWDALRRRLTNTADSLHVADFDGNGTADVALVDTQASRYRRRVSRDGIGNSVTLISPTLTQPAAIGAFVPDDPRASLLLWSAKTLWRATYAETPVRHARQDMR